jgi:molecular chaperone DnaK (HSP70)
MNKPHRVVAGIDFGTYGTGFAWAPVSEDNDEPGRRRISFFEDWAGQKSVGYPKNRSAVLLDAGGEFVTWGYEALAQMTSAPPGSGLRLRTGFKMALQPGPPDPAAAVAGDAGVVLAGHTADAYRLTVLCLRQVVAMARERITSGAYEDGDIRWCVTVPAIWGQYTRDLMFKAAVEAGLPDDPARLLLAQEPAVAALYCKAKGDAMLGTPGTRFLVIDAGGGTVDVSCYQVADGGDLRELAPADGAETGSDFLNVAFLNEILTERFGVGTIGRILAERRGAIADTMDSWERAKRAFSADSDEDVVIHLSASFYAGLVREQATGRWAGREEPATEVVVSHALVAALFEQSIDKTMTCIERQLREMRAASGSSGGEVALLVGGFAESPYLRTGLTRRLAAQDVRVLVPAQPAVAVLAGAVHYAYDKSGFKSWRAPFTLGFLAAMPFRPGIDPESRKKINAAGQERCSGRFDIFFANRAEVTPGEPVTRTYTPIKENQKTIKLQLLSADRADVEFSSEPGVETLATLTVDLSTSLNRPVAERQVEVAMYLDQANIKVEARNVETDEPQSVNIEWQNW